MVTDVFFIDHTPELLAPLHRISYCILRSSADAEDAVQQGLMKAWAAKNRAAPDTFRPWVTRIVINEARNIQRHRMRVTPVDKLLMSEAFMPPDSDVMDAVYALPEPLRVLFTMKYVAGYKEREIAVAMRLPLSMVKNRLARARQLLRDTLSDTEVTFE